MAIYTGDTGGSGRMPGARPVPLASRPGRAAGLYSEISRPSAASRSRGDRAAGEDERLKPLR